jgi:hypothetical protein
LRPVAGSPLRPVPPLQVGNAPHEIGGDLLRIGTPPPRAAFSR